MGYPVRPSGYPGWGSTGMTNIAEPTDAKKGYGWGVNEQPPSSYFNWLFQIQDQWIQYLDWRGKLVDVVENNCLPIGAYGFTGMTAGGATTLDEWQHYSPSQVNLIGNNWDVTLSEHPNAVNGRVWASIGSGYAHILANVAGVADRGFRMEHILDFETRPIASGYSIEAGLMYNHSGVSGCNLQLGWVATGRSGQLCAMWTPSGRTPTSIAFASGYAAGAGHGWTKHHKLTIEARGVTMAFYSNDILQAAVGSIPVGAVAGSQMFGVRIGGQSALTKATVNYMKLSTARDPI
jgi:hypothetical protein